MAFSNLRQDEVDCGLGAQTAVLNQHVSITSDFSYGRPPVFKRQSSFENMNPKMNGSQETTSDVGPDPIGSFHDRLTSFNTWPNWACISPTDVALAGMRYMGQEDKVQCDFCKGILYSWEENDNPLYEHRKHFSACEFLKGRSWEVVQRHLTQQQQTQAQQKHDDNICNTDTNNKHDDDLCNTDTNNKHTSSLDTVIDIVTQMGYTEEIINIAIKKLLMTLTRDKINTSILLDHIFELESEGNLSETDDYLCKDLSGIVIVDKDNVLTKQTRLDKCDKRIFCNASNVVVDPSVLNCSIARAASNVYPQVKGQICDDLQADCDSDSSLCDMSILKPHDVSKCLSQNRPNKDNDFENNQDKTKSVKSKQLTVQNDTKIYKLIEQRDCLQKAVVCNVCKSKKVELLFLPCRHMVACDNCGSRLDNCLKCSQRIVATVRVYMI